MNKSHHYWLFILVFLFGIIEGALRKWYIPASPAIFGYLIYLSKDIVFMALVLFTPTVRKGYLASKYKRNLTFALILIGIGILLSILMQGVNSAGAFLNMRSMIVLPLLAYFAANKLLNIDVIWAAKWIAVLSFLPAILSIIQFNLPASHILNTYVNHHALVITYGGHVRATGTFSFISGMGILSVIAVWAGMFIFVTTNNSKERIFGVATIIAGLVCASTSASRAGMFLAIAIVVATFLLSKYKTKIILHTIIVFIVGAALMPGEHAENIANPYADIAANVFERHAESDSITERVVSRSKTFIEAILETPMGAGFGYGQVGGAAVLTGKRQFLRHESEQARLISEIGLVGYVGTLLIFFSTIYLLFVEWTKLTDGVGKNGLLVFVLSIGAFFLSNMYFNHVVSGFAWPLIALSFVWAEQQRTSTKFHDKT